MFKNWSNTTKIVVGSLAILGVLFFLYQMKWLGNSTAIGERSANGNTDTYSPATHRTIIVAKPAPSTGGGSACPSPLIKDPVSGRCCEEATGTGGASGSQIPTCTGDKMLKVVMVGGLPKYVCC